SDIRDERGELFDLEAQGAEPRTLRTHLRLRTAFVAVVGALGVIATGAVLAALIIALVTLTAGAGASQPPLVLAVDWPIVLLGLDRPSGGAVRGFGREIGKLPAGEVARYRTQTVGYPDQHYSRALSPELTARELVGLELGLAGWTRPERGHRADELLERVGLTD